MAEIQIDEIREQKSLFGVNTDEGSDLQLDEIRAPKSIFCERSNETEQGDIDMQTLGLTDDDVNTEEWEARFWRRQFQQVPTQKQKKYDWAFGVIMPVVCFFFDPFIFKFWGQSEGGILGAYKPFFYAGSFISVLGMMAWLLWRDRLGGYGALLAGLFFVAGTFSLLLGIPLIPVSLIASMALIGLIGFTPLFTSVIFFRNGVRALRAAGLNFDRSKLIAAVILGSLWGFAIPYALNVEVQRSLNEIGEGTPETIRNQGLKLRLMAPLVDSEQLKKAYWKAPKDSEQRKEIMILYRQTTGKDFTEYPRWE